MGTHRFENLGIVMKARADRIEANMTGIVRKVAAAADQTIVRSTPADTGEARSNWVGQVDAPFTGRLPPYAPGSKLGMGEAANANAAIAQARGAINTFDVRRNKVIYLSNFTPYIGPLNDGGPQGARPPAAAMQFVERGLDAGVVEARKHKVLAGVSK